jgi:hypothetical protein
MEEFRNHARTAAFKIAEMLKQSCPELSPTQADQHVLLFWNGVVVGSLRMAHPLFGDPKKLSDRTMDVPIGDGGGFSPTVSHDVAMFAANLHDELLQKARSTP